MAKKILYASLTLCLVSISAFSQGVRSEAMEKKLNSLYRKTVPLVYAEDLTSEMREKKKVLLLDTRSREEYNVSHIEGAKFVDYDSFKSIDVKTIDKNADIVVYCSVGYRSERIGEALLKMGFSNVRNLYGGIFDWVNQGNEVVNHLGNKTDSVHTYNRDWSRWLTKGVKVY